MVITKVKFSAGIVMLDYELKHTTPGSAIVDTIKANFKSSDTPMPSFDDALQSLRDEVEIICCLPKGYCKEARVIGVSYSYTGGIMGAVISILIPVITANGPIMLNTPYLPCESNKEEDFDEETTKILPASCTQILHTILEEAQSFYKGNRQQAPSLFDEIQDSEQKHYLGEEMESGLTEQKAG